MHTVLWTEQTGCYDTDGRPVACSGTGQDAEHRPDHVVNPRFVQESPGTILDLVTQLTWTESANYGDFPRTWPDALNFVHTMNRENALGYHDWRLPNRRELRSLISFGARNPALSPSHPFNNVFLGWYWTSTTAAMFPAYAWYIHMEGGRMFYGKKDQYALVWPVRGIPQQIAATGQTSCYDVHGMPLPCQGTGQDGASESGEPWPSPRFSVTNGAVKDALTSLVWCRDADILSRPLSWQDALDAAAPLNTAGMSWRVPTINELESLVDASTFSPALPRDHPFQHVREAYWSSTSSFFKPDWAHVLYLHKGAVGVGWKRKKEFYLWPVAGPF